jgi:hypothetical protein
LDCFPFQQQKKRLAAMLAWAVEKAQRQRQRLCWLSLATAMTILDDGNGYPWRRLLLSLMTAMGFIGDRTNSFEGPLPPAKAGILLAKHVTQTPQYRYSKRAVAC